jgi:hypothetical protein
MEVVCAVLQELHSGRKFGQQHQPSWLKVHIGRKFARQQRIRRRTLALSDGTRRLRQAEPA